jgi:hypothetical protein
MRRGGYAGASFWEMAASWVTNLQLKGFTDGVAPRGPQRAAGNTIALAHQDKSARNTAMMHGRRTNPRAEYRLRQSQRAQESVSLAEKFPQLKSLTVHLEHVDADTLSRNSEMKYKVNVEHAKSVFCFGCPSGECIGGDFDLSDVLAKAVHGRRKLAAGEIRCQGWHKKAKIDKAPCQILLRYKLNLDYGRG